MADLLMKRSGFKRKTGYQWKSRARLNKNSKRVNSNRYKEEQWKKAVRARDRFQCQFPKCFFFSRSIDAHHIAMRSRRPDLKFTHDNGICLCREHHAWIHANQAEAVAMGLLSTDSYEKAAHDKLSLEITTDERLSPAS